MEERYRITGDVEHLRNGVFLSVGGIVESSIEFIGQDLFLLGVEFEILARGGLRRGRRRGGIKLDGGLN